MDIGELFLNLGVKGTEKTVGALSNVKKSLGEIGSMSLEAKAGIIAAMYALERLFAASGKAGTDLTNFNAITGDSVKTLQQYQYAARQVGVSNQEVEGSFKSLQSSMTKTMMGEGAPKGLARVAMLAGNISQEDIQNYAKQPELLIKKLQEYASKETNIGLRNETLKSFGLGENMIAALSRNAFRPEILKKAPTYSDSEVKQLDKANIAWSNLGTKIEMAVGHFNAMHGGQLVSDISKIVSAVFKLIDAFTTLAEKLHVFDGIAKVFGFITSGLGDINDKAAVALSDKKGLLHGGFTQGKALVGDFIQKDVSLAKSAGNFLVNQYHSAVAPSVTHHSNEANRTQNNNVTVNNNFSHSGVDPKKTEHSVKHAINTAYRQLHAQAGGS